jgi:predicted MPP superfamily phosphohydrolase
VEILHLTDLHYQLDNPFQKQLIKALLTDLKTDGFSPDYIVFSGDLVQNPDDPNIYNHFYENFLAPVSSAVGLTDRQIVLCPGNHDVSHRLLTDWGDTRAKVKDVLAGDNDALDKFLKSDPAQSYVRQICSGFFKLAERCGHAWPDPLSHIYSFPDENVAFVALNSAYGCGLEGSAYDKGKLAIPAAQILSAFQRVPEGQLVMSLIHHTPGDFNESTTRTTLPIIQRHSDIHYYGHVHDPRPTTMKSPSASCFLIQGGALYENSRAYDGYARIYVTPDTKLVAARYRTYYFNRETFDVGTNVEDMGVFYSS